MYDENAVRELREELRETRDRVLARGATSEGARVALGAVIGGIAACDVILEEEGKDA